ncbi:probable sucrose-phosphate synthase, partial [Rosa chinensis]|uniref:probable sucrose-phosphate synthase n=1 Tax=Rosa chinensis TaxID=74649 RepID=UPI001AD8A3B8
MAGNDWVNSYLEAILDVGPGLDDAKSSSSLLLRERGRFSPTRYFVEEVITRYDETDLHRSWVRVCAESNLVVNLDFTLRRRRGVPRRGTVGDISAHNSDSTRGGRMRRINSMDVMANWAAHQKEKKFYIVLISLHGLIRGENMELGRDSDTGGQVKYVVELARALGSMPGVYRVDLLTRQVSSPDVDWSYGEPTEMLNPVNSENPQEELGESTGAYIVRIPFV